MRSDDPIFQKVISTNEYNKDRQPIIKRIQNRIGAKLIVYTANMFHPLAQIMIHDLPAFEDLLRSVAGSKNDYLMINSPGGNADAAEKLLTMCRQRFTDSFNVIVPDYAKSAASMLALGSDKILMGYLAELGPIDPQLVAGPLPMAGSTIPARSFIDGLELIRKKIREGDPVQMYYPMIAQIRPEIIARCESAIEGSRKFAEKWLKRFMFKNNPKQAEKVAKWLSMGEEYKSHGKMIDFEEAKNKLQLNVEKIDPNSDLWSDVWELYCRSTYFLQTQGPNAAKLYESESVSFTLSIQALLRKVSQLRPQPPPKQPPLPPQKLPPQHPQDTPQKK
jgi:hypothetical protein